MNGIVWWEVETSAPSAFRDFHGAVWGWTFRPAFEDTELGAEYWIIESAGASLGGLQASSEGRAAAAGVRLYIEVEDLESTLLHAQQLGATIERERTKLGGPDRWFAIITDPAGISWGLWTPNA